MSKSISPATPKPDKLRFPRAARIRLGREFALVRTEGRSVQGRLLRLSAMKIGDATKSGETRFGIITSRRVGGAVDRNRVRRRLREICREQRVQVGPGWLVVVIAKSTAVSAAFADLREEWLLLARRLSILPRS